MPTLLLPISVTTMPVCFMCSERPMPKRYAQIDEDFVQQRLRFALQASSYTRVACSQPITPILKTGIQPQSRFFTTC
jgi:hypothetical protein